MNEFTKTLLFAGCAAVAVAGAVIGRPGRVGIEAPDQIGMPLFGEFTDAEAAESLEVTEFDELENNLTTFQVAKKNGVWVIPSHEDYAADATDNLKAAANMFVDINVLNVAGDKNSSHGTFGVLEPSSENLDAGPDAMGKLVKMKDGKGKRLVDIIIGKEVKGQGGQRYVRIPKQDRVYTVSLDPSKLSTKFGDWIQPDVLQLNPMDIEDMIIRDYTVTPMVSADRSRIIPELEHRLRMRVHWNADDFKWDLLELLEAPNKELRPTELLEGETLDKAKLDEMKNALAGLKIVDVSPKPPGLREGLKEGQEEFWNDRESAMSLITRGFYPPLEIGAVGITATSGEVTAITTDGVNITLSFGQIAGADDENQEKLNRYVVIAASIDEASLPQPELEDLPDDPAGPTTPKDGSDQITDAPDAGADDAVAESTESDPMEVERDRVAKANQRKLDEYDAKRKKAQDKVDELNLRFADWYYVISEDVYKDIHLSRVDVIAMDETKADAGAGIDAFRKLEQEGLKQKQQDQEQE